MLSFDKPIQLIKMLIFFPELSFVISNLLSFTVCIYEHNFLLKSTSCTIVIKLKTFWRSSFLKLVQLTQGFPNILFRPGRRNIWSTENSHCFPLVTFLSKSHCLTQNIVFYNTTSMDFAMFSIN